MNSNLGKFTLALGLTAALLGASCSRTKEEVRPEAGATRLSDVKVQVETTGPVKIASSNAEFQVLPSGYIQATRSKDGTNSGLDEPQGDSNYVVSGGKETHFALDFSKAKTEQATGKMGRGVRVQIPGKAAESPLEQTLTLEVYDDFPNIMLATAEYKNAGSSDIAVDEVVAQRHHLISTGAKAPYDMWSFHGSSSEWGKDDVVHLTRTFAQPNSMGEAVKGGYGGGIPIVAFWNQNTGEAIGHIETLPLTLSVPVKVEADSRVSASVNIPAKVTLKPGESYATPRTFVSVYAGDFYEPLRLWSNVLAKEGWVLPKPSSEAYNISWCGWGYEFNVTPKEMLGTVPKLKELGIKWATLDDRWFNTYGDWEPRHETFPGDSIKKMTDDFHKEGIFVQLWWLPLGVEDGKGRWESHKYIVSKVVQEHPEWLILNKDGSHARMTRDLAALCPAVPEVQAYHKKLTEKFIREFGFDGSKLDNIYSVPKCYNPAHHHKSPQDSVNAVADVYKTIFDTSKAIKPESVTQSCPCGTPPSLAWLPFMDQAVTADPVGAVQVRRRVKMYKALLGPEAAVYGDHVELSAMSRSGNSWKEHGDDFASTIGTGAVVGTKFVWPDPGPHYKPVALTPEKDAIWKKWIGLYNEKMLSKGTFRDLYVYGYDVPEGYAIEKDGKMYYAFFAPAYKGEVELRGLKTGTYHVTDYAEGKDLGTADASGEKAPRLAVDFKEHLLLEVAP